jgi:hypothetical protein
MGLALFLGMEAVPLIAIPISFATGVMLIVWWLTQPDKRLNLKWIVIYAFACGVGIGAYYLLQFLPNIPESWSRYRAFVQSYSSVTGVGTVRLPLERLIDYIGRFSLILSPAELIASLLSFVVLWRMKHTAERWMLASIGVGFVLLLVFFRLSYSYMAAFTPFMAYAIARVMSDSRVRASLVLGVVLPALIAVPVFDLTEAIQTRPNEVRLETADVLAPNIPDGATVVGEDLLWFTLHDKHTFIGINGLYNYVAIQQVGFLEALQTLHVDMMVCDSGNDDCDLPLQTGYFSEPISQTVGSSTYLLYPRSGG